MPFRLEKKSTVGWIICLNLLLTAPHGVAAKDEVGKKPASEATDTVIATMGDVKLYSEELNKLFANSDPKARTRVLTNPKLLEQTIREELLKKFIVQQATASGYDKQAAVQWAMSRAGDNILLELYVNSKAKPEDSFPSEAMIKEAYQQNIKNFDVPHQVHVAQIFLPLEGDDKAKKVTADQMADLAKKAKAKNADFASLAKEHSKHVESAANGGDMGWIPVNQLLPEIAKEVATMKAGDIKGPFHSPQGLHIVKLIESKAASVRSLEEAKPVLIAGLKKQRLETLRAQFLKDLLDKTPAIINSENVSKLK
ncbi:MAG: peptidylprolyl isomerase [Magnetococcales bacterium]|nr:peptidylprolyl isomerase [Magnetococcales bacterium]MBF0421214.1 peptidylprolyl isomerase [Magnetococcales bacterium]